MIAVKIACQKGISSCKEHVTVMGNDNYTKNRSWKIACVMIVFV